MIAEYRLTKEDLLDELTIWDQSLTTDILLVACGGTALTLSGYKASTKDVDFLVPIPDHFQILIKLLTKLNYFKVTGYGYRHPSRPWLFDLFFGQRVFQTDLLDPIQDPGKHRVIRKFKNIILAALNSDDLIISKMFRGTLVDTQDSVLLIKTELLDLSALAKRYRDTADYYYNPSICKKNLNYLISDLEMEGINAGALREVEAEWIL